MSRVGHFFWGSPQSELRHLCSTYSQFNDFGFFMAEDPQYEFPKRDATGDGVSAKESRFEYLSPVEFVSLF